jgi:putative cell wall-binding protein
LSIRTKRSSKRLVAALATAGIAASTLAITTPAGAAQTVTESRVFGADRYGTAAAVALATFPGGSNNIILASGTNFPDGLAAAGLAGVANAPILLTSPDSLPAATASAIGTLDAGVAGAATIHIIGGEAAVSPAVRAQLTALGYTLNEIAGADRYETSAAVAEFAGSLAPIGVFGGKPTAILATGAGFADALAAGAPAFSGRHPILLTSPTSLPSSVADALDAIGATQVIIMGGTSAVSDDVKAAVEALGISTVRVAGANRYETAKNLADILVTPAASGGFGYYDAAPQEIVLVSGENFADALAAGPHAGAIRAPMLLVQQCAIPTPTAEFHVENNALVDLVRAIGGPAAICEDVLDGAVAAATQVTPTATITAEQSRPTFTVVFSEKVVAASVTAADFTISRVGATVEAGAITAIDTDTDGNATTFTVGVNETSVANVDALVTGDVVSLLAGGVSTPAPARVNAAAQVVVAADTTRPTVASIVAPAGSTTVYVSFSEPMATGTIDAADFTVNGVAASGLGAYVPASNTQLVTVPALVSGQTFAVVDSSMTDLAGNAVVGTSRVIFPDSTAPAVTSATLSSVVQTTASGTTITSGTGEIDLVSVATGPAAGAAGNGYTFTFTQAEGASPSVSVNSTTRVITVTGDFTAPNAVEATALAVAWSQSPAAALFTPVVTTAGAMTAPAAAATSGGTSTVSAALTFSEAVTGVAAGDFVLASSNSVFATTTAFTGTVGLADPLFSQQLTVTVVVNNPTALPVAGTAEVRVAAGGFTDLSLNANGNQALPLAAAS